MSPLRTVVRSRKWERLDSSTDISKLTGSYHVNTPVPRWEGGGVVTFFTNISCYIVDHTSPRGPTRVPEGTEQCSHGSGSLSMASLSILVCPRWLKTSFFIVSTSRNPRLIKPYFIRSYLIPLSPTSRSPMIRQTPKPNSPMLLSSLKSTYTRYLASLHKESRPTI